MESAKGDPDPPFPLLFHLNPASLLLSSLSRISFSFPICIDPRSNVGECCFLGSSQILHLVNIFPNTSLFVVQIPDPVNTLTDPVSKLSCTLNLKPPLSQPLRKAWYSSKPLNCSYNQWQNNYCWEIVLKWGTVPFKSKLTVHCESRFSTQFAIPSGNKTIHTPPPPIRSKLGCLLFPTGSLNSSTTWCGGTGGNKALFSPFYVGKTSEEPFRAIKCLFVAN